MRFGARLSDVLCVRVPTFPNGGTRYPSVNKLGSDWHRGGKKTPEYNALFNAVLWEACDQMLATGWMKADYLVEVHWKRYVTTRRKSDASNAGKCEFDALQSAGVVVNDHLIRPFCDVPQYDPTPGAIDRIVMVVLRLFPPAIGAAPPMRKPCALGLEKPVKAIGGRIGDGSLAHVVYDPVVSPILTRALPRSLDELKSGDVVTMAERDALLKKVGMR